ncbi:MAG: hypothetical protein KJ578_11885 [Bacteroidetes bacterium]|nr:hypothetical protein [Bacteroidota bacterium]MBU1577896.1 hypothetical protein [Bacteroidota bacterium]MBU2558470.1 hypothetical protein [Bacteroidota bacterium]
MKTLLLHTLYSTAFFVFFSALNLNAQIYQGEAPSADKQNLEEEMPKSKGSSGAYKTKFTHFVYFMPDMTPVSSHTYGPFKMGAGPKWGAMIESGAFRFFDDNFMLNGMGNIGLYSSFGFGASFHDFQLPPDFEGLKLPFFFADLKLGPDIRLEFIDFAKVDIYGNIGVLASYGGLVGTLSDDTFYKPTKPVIALQTGLGLNVALGRFVIGAQYTMANGSYEFDITEDQDYYSGSVPEEENNAYEVNLNSLRVHIGIYTERRRR